MNEYFIYVRDEVKFSCAEAESKFNSIQPSAIVHPDAILGQRCFHWSFLHCWTFCKIGKCLPIIPWGAVVGDDLPGLTVIGNNNIIGHHAVMGIKCQDMKYKPGNECFLEIGDNNEIREYTSVHRSSHPNERTVIGDKNLIMGSCHIAHDCKVGNNNIFANNTLLAGHVTVEDYTRTAGATVIHQFCYIGSFSFIGGGSVIKSLRAAYIKIFMPSDGIFRSIEERLSELEKDEELGQVPVVRMMI
ncbi:hypothetical protein CASFOL_030552 [Castilleja foliolosa]|uniref:Acyl-[acyl-carrier-protein]--UDP-N-acetylglucosamine O-acyltransferase n=1 Tax=Castilleja foliolosa TaxID=1961234 RepID=A0ABD3CA56_9LAMI